MSSNHEEDKKIRRIYRIETSLGRGPFAAMESEETHNQYPYNYDSAFPIAETNLVDLAVDQEWLFACPTLEQIKRYFKEAFEGMLRAGAILYEILVPETEVIEDETQCVFDPSAIIEKIKIDPSVLGLLLQ